MRYFQKPPRLLTAILLYPLGILSLLLCLIGGGMWIRSYHVADGWDQCTVHQQATDQIFRDYHLWSGKGGLGIYFTQYSNLVYRPPSYLLIHNTTMAMEYPYCSVEISSAKNQPWKFGPFSYWSHEELDHTNLWVMTVYRGYVQSGDKGYYADRAKWVSLVFPWYLLIIIGLPLVLLSCRRFSSVRRWNDRIRKGLCASCGYDLRATKERCPECGRVADGGK